MAHKLLVITAGTVAAGVGFEFLKQVRTHPASELHTMVRYIDTAYLPTRYSDLRSGEWFQMTISPQFMDNVRRNPGNYPDLQGALYPGLLPQIAGSGGGSIRYNAAGALLINMAKMKDWLTNSMTNLVNSGDRQVNLSIVLVVSSVGATGSGTVERLIDVIVDCAQSVSIPSPLHCDVFILQPGMQGVTDLGLSNTLALYAEMASTRLAKNDFNADVNQKAYRGRTMLVGWGSQRYMASIDELKEEAATLVRLTHDPSTDIAAEFQEREVDNHVLREQDWQTHLPSHLSTATAVTISLGDLEEKIIRRDAVRLIDMLVFGGKPAEAASGEYVIPGASKAEHQAGPLLGKLTNFLQGDTPEERYRHLVDRLTENLTGSINSLQMTAMKLKDLSTQEQAGRLRNTWQLDKEEIAKRGRRSIQEQGAALAGTARNEIRSARLEAIATGLSLRDLRDEYQEMETILASVMQVSPDSIQGASDAEVTRRINGIGSLFGRDRALQQAIGAVQGNIQQTLSRESHAVALEVLQVLQSHCSESLRNLEIVLQRLLRQRKSNPKWAAGDQDFTIDMNHLLHMAALSTPGEITRYADLVSIFASYDQQQQRREASGTIARMIEGDGQQIDLLAAFRKWLDDQRKLDDLFAGEIDVLLELAQNYARQYVHEEVKQHSVVDVLLQAGEEILVERLKDAAAKAHSLVSYNPQFAGELREARLLSAYFRNEEQRGVLLKAINQAFGDGQCVLVPSRDPSEIVVFYYADGLPMSAVTDLTGRCLDAFLRRRQSWYRQSKVGNNGTENSAAYNQRVGVPVYSGKDTEQRVLDTGVIRDLYLVRGQNVATYKANDIPELVDGKDPK